MKIVMGHSGAHSSFELSPRWKARAARTCAIPISPLFSASGAWKLSNLDASAKPMVQSLVPNALSMPAAIAVAARGTISAALLLFARRRRWGAWLAGLTLAAFMIYIGVLYDRLLGEDCNCFPWIRRVVGPVLLIGDRAMLILVVLAGWCSLKSYGWRRAAVIFLCVLVVAAASNAATSYQRSRAEAPETAVVDGKSLNLQNRRLLLYFFDRECTHCYAVEREMAQRSWSSTRIVVLATREQQFTPSFLADTGLRVGISPAGASLRQVFPLQTHLAPLRWSAGNLWRRSAPDKQMKGNTYYDAPRNLGYLN
jgi:hypothetical protein